jgi:predicted ATPase
VVTELQVLVAREPLREELRELLMRALYGVNRQAEALAVYDAGRRLLRDELGLEPAATLRALHRRLLTQTEEVVAPPAIPTVRRNLLPGLLDETFGRDRDLAALESLLGEGRGRLVSLLGPGGVGKTRVSVELAHRLGDRYRDGIAFVPLVEAEKPHDVAATICSALGVPAAEDATESLVAALQTRRMLLICDNFEHVSDAGELLLRLLESAPGLHVLVTSRVTLRLRGEQQYRLEPLAHQATAGPSPSVALFVARARAADATFDPTEQELVDIAEICARCDGLPLAIELAAARVRALRVAELLDRLADPLPVLRGTSPDLPERHRTLRASIARSIEGLPTTTQRALGRLTVCRGGFTLPAVATVADLGADEALECVETLLDHNLLQPSRGAQGGLRFDLLETIRRYAAELAGLEEVAAAQRRHATFFRDLLDPAPDPTPTPSSAARWLAQLAERPNIRAAIRWALAGSDGDLAADLVIGAVAMWTSVGPRNELDSWVALLLARSDIPPGRRVDALYARGLSQDRAGDNGGLGSTLAEAMTLATTLNDTRRQAWVTAFSAWRAARVGEAETAGSLVARLETLALQHEEAEVLQAWSLFVRGTVTADTALAHQHMEAGLLHARTHNLDTTVVLMLSNVAEVALVSGDAHRAQQLIEEAIPLAASLADDEDLTWLIGLRGYAHLRLGDAVAARHDGHTAISQAVRMALLVGGCQSLLFLAAANATSDPVAAAQYLGIVDSSRSGVEPPVERQARETFLADLPQRLGAGYSPAYQRGVQLVAERGALAALAAVGCRATDSVP